MTEVLATKTHVTHGLLLSQYSYGKMSGGGRSTGRKPQASRREELSPGETARGLSQWPGKCAPGEREQARDVQRCAGLGTDIDNVANRLDYRLIAILGAQPWAFCTELHGQLSVFETGPC